MNGGLKPAIRDQTEEALRRLVEENNHLTLAEYRDRLAAATGVRVDPDGTAHSDDCSHRFRSKPALCSERSQPGIPMIPAG